MSALSESKRQAIVQIARLLEPLGIDWVVTGSVSQALQGAPVTPKDIDIKTRAEDIGAVQTAMSAYVIEPVKYRASEKFRSFFGQVKIAGEEVDLMGGLELLNTDGEWVSGNDPSADRVWVALEGVQIPVIDVRRAAKTYRQMGRFERADLLDNWLRDQE